MKRKEIDKSVDRHIRIWDMSLMEQIDKIMEYPEFKSFGKVINEALYIALPQILDRLEGKEKITLPPAEEERRPPMQHRPLIDEEFYGVLVRLLKEIVLNVVINKSILSSLFHAKCLENEGCRVPETFGQGLMSDTPEYLADFETEGLKKMRQ